MQSSCPILGRADARGVTTGNILRADIGNENA